MSPSDGSLDNEMAELIDSFIVETGEILEKLSQNLLDLEKRPDDSELHNTIFRAVHTIKGTSSFLGFDQMTELAHVFEDVLNKIRKKEISVGPAEIDLILESYDLLKVLIQRIEEKNKQPLDLTSIVARLKAVASGASSKAKPAAPPPPQNPEPKAGPVEQAAAVAESTVDEQASAEPAALEPATAAQAPADQAPASPNAAGAQKTAAESTIRVDVNRLDNLMNLVGELVLGRNRLSQISGIMGEEFESHQISRDLSETSSQIDLITTELQLAVMKTRMVPIGKVFNKMPRLIRDLCRDMSKEIDLQIIGEETELDKSITEELNDPLVHILRNSADHGVEIPEERVASGKPRMGTVVLKAEHEGNHIVITVKDDGKGMDTEILKRKAIDKGIITAAEAADMSRNDAFNLIFLPGFSTAQKVTNVSGRGVGMDVVRTNITRLKGIIEIESEVGKGSTFTIKLPLTLAIIQGLLAQVGDEIFAIPLGSVLEVVRIKDDDISTVGGTEVIRLRNSVLPLARLSEVLHVNRGGTSEGWMYVVVVGVAEKRLGIIVDDLIGQKEVVIKALGGFFGDIPGLAGSTILGDGRVIMIIDVGQLIAMCAEVVHA
jgi:two-component system, chemotaxis family, sensor kinase CheA